MSWYVTIYLCYVVCVRNRKSTIVSFLFKFDIVVPVKRLTQDLCESFVIGK